MVDLTLDANITPESVYYIANHPDLAIMFDQGPPTIQQIKQALSVPGVGVCLVRHGANIVGYIALRKKGADIAEISGGFITGYRGKAAKKIIVHFINLLFKSGAIKIVGEVLPENRQCLAMAAALGFKREGQNRLSRIVDGKLRDQIYMGLTIKDWKYGSSLWH